MTTFTWLIYLRQVDIETIKDLCNKKTVCQLSLKNSMDITKIIYFSCCLDHSKIVPTEKPVVLISNGRGLTSERTYDSLVNMLNNANLIQTNCFNNFDPKQITRNSIRHFANRPPNHSVNYIFNTDTGNVDVTYSAIEVKPVIPLVSDKDTIVGKILGYPDMLLPYDPELSLIEWQQKLVELVPNAYINDKTFSNAIYQNNILINCPENRHKKIGEVLDNTKHIVFVIFFNPTQYAKIKGNMRNDGREFDRETCPICMEKFTYTLYKKNTIISLDECHHTFHLKCLCDANTNRCPSCTLEIKNISSLQLVQKNING